jgi:hypothetical protein
MLPDAVERITENKNAPKFCVIEGFDTEVVSGAK